MNSKNNSMKFRITFFVVGLVVDTIGNGLTISSNTGSAMWTAASVNVSNLLNVSIPLLIFTFGFIYAIINQFLLSNFNGMRFFSEVMFMVLFSYFIDLFSNLFLLLHINDLNFTLRSIISIIGITLIGVAISLYQRANLILHPNDDNTNLLRFKYLHGNSTLSQLISNGPAVILILIAWLFSGHLFAINIATVYYLLCIGVIVKWSDQLIIPRLKHNVRSSGEI